MDNRTRRTILRKTNTSSVQQVTEQLLNMFTFKGIDDSTNYATVDQNSFSEADNVYTDGDSELATRPPVKYTKLFENMPEGDIDAVYTSNSTVFYLINHKLYWRWDNKTYETGELCETDEEGNKTYYTTFKVVWINDMFIVFEQYGEGDDKTTTLFGLQWVDGDWVVRTMQTILYIPAIDYITGEELESKNIFTDSMYEHFVFDGIQANVEAISRHLDGTEITITFHDAEFKIVWNRQCEYVFISEICFTMASANFTAWQSDKDGNTILLYDDETYSRKTYLSRDGGSSWTEVTLGDSYIPQEGANAFGVALSEDGNAIFVVFPEITREEDAELTCKKISNVKTCYTRLHIGTITDTTVNWNNTEFKILDNDTPFTTRKLNEVLPSDQRTEETVNGYSETDKFSIDCVWGPVYDGSASSYIGIASGVNVPVNIQYIDKSRYIHIHAPDSSHCAVIMPVRIYWDLLYDVLTQTNISPEMKSVYDTDDFDNTAILINALYLNSFTAWFTSSTGNKDSIITVIYDVDNGITHTVSLHDDNDCTDIKYGKLRYIIGTDTNLLLSFNKDHGSYAIIPQKDISAEASMASIDSVKMYSSVSEKLWGDRYTGGNNNIKTRPILCSWYYTDENGEQKIEPTVDNEGNWTYTDPGTHARIPELSGSISCSIDTAQKSPAYTPFIFRKLYNFFTYNSGDILYAACPFVFKSFVNDYNDSVDSNDYKSHEYDVEQEVINKGLAANSDDYSLNKVNSNDNFANFQNAGTTIYNVYATGGNVQAYAFNISGLSVPYLFSELGIDAMYVARMPLSIHDCNNDGYVYVENSHFHESLIDSYSHTTVTVQNGGTTDQQYYLYDSIPKYILYKDHLNLGDNDPAVPDEYCGPYVIKRGANSYLFVHTFFDTSYLNASKNEIIVDHFVDDYDDRCALSKSYYQFFDIEEDKEYNENKVINVNAEYVVLNKTIQYRRFVTDTFLYYNNEVTEFFWLDDTFNMLPLTVTQDGRYFVGLSNASEAWYNTVWTNNYADYGETFEINVLIASDTHIEIPDFDVITYNSTTLAFGNLLYQTQVSVNDDYEKNGYKKLYIPASSKVTIAHTITALISFSQQVTGIFTEFTAYEYLYNEDYGGYQMFPTKLTLGNRAGYDVLPSLAGNSIYIATIFGFGELSYENFVQSTEQQFGRLADAINTIFKDYDTSPIKMVNYDYWTFLYRQDTDMVLVYDLRYQSWWIWHLPIVPELMYIQGSELWIYSEKKVFCLDFTDDTCYDIDNTRIAWRFASQKLHFEYPAYYKHVNSLAVVGTPNTDTMRYALEFYNYHNGYDTQSDTVVKYDVETVANCIKRVNFMKTDAFKFALSSDDTDNYPIKFKIAGLTIKYRVTEKIR